MIAPSAPPALVLSPGEVVVAEVVKHEFFTASDQAMWMTLWIEVAEGRRRGEGTTFTAMIRRPDGQPEETGAALGNDIFAATGTPHSAGVAGLLNKPFLIIAESAPSGLEVRFAPLNRERRHDA